MHPNWLGVLSAILAIVAFYFTARSAVKLPMKRRLLLTVPALLLALPGASFAVYYAHLLPEPAWYYQFRSIPGTEFLVGVAGGLIAALLPRLVLLLPFFGVAAFTIVPVIKPFVGPIPDGSLNDEWDGEVCIQSNASTCGNASVATILRSFGEHTTEAEIAAEAHSYTGGTEAWYLARTVRSRGHQARFRFSSGFDPDIELPAVAGVRLSSFGHFIPILNRDGDRFVIGDPLRGMETLSQDELLERYEFTEFHMCVEK